jgi:ribA/ribD-fused uncharacterized protein
MAFQEVKRRPGGRTEPPPSRDWRLEPGAVLFSRTGPLGWLANWHRAPFDARGRSYHHVEGWMQASKHAGNPEFARAIRAAASASQARDMGAARQLWADLDVGKRPLTPAELDRWQASKLGILHEGVLAKFAQNPPLGRKLAATGDAPLVYDCDNAFYGCGRDGLGHNHLGRALMRVRAEVRRPPPRP